MHGNTSQAAVDPVRENPENYRNTFWIDVAETWYGAGFICFMSDQKAAGWAQKNNRVHILQEQIGYPRVISTATQVAIAESGGEWEQGAITDIQFPVQDRTPVMQALKEADCGVILISHWVAAELASFAPSYALGPTPGSLVYPQYGPPQPEFLNLAGDAAEGFIRGPVIGTSADETGMAFRATYMARYAGTMGMVDTGSGYDTFNIQAKVRATRDPSDFDAGQAHLIFQVQDGAHTIISPAVVKQAGLRPAPWIWRNRNGAGRPHFRLPGDR